MSVKREELTSVSISIRENQERFQKIEAQQKKQNALIVQGVSFTSAFVGAGVAFITALAFNLYLDANTTLHRIGDVKMQWLQENNRELKQAAETQRQLTQEVLVKIQEAFAELKREKAEMIASQAQSSQIPVGSINTPATTQAEKKVQPKKAKPKPVRKPKVVHHKKKAAPAKPKKKPEIAPVLNYFNDY